MSKIKTYGRQLMHYGRVIAPKWPTRVTEGGPLMAFARGVLACVVFVPGFVLLYGAAIAEVARMRSGA